MAIQTAEIKTSVPSSPLLGFWKIFSRNRIAVFGVGMLIFVVLVAVFAPLIAPFNPKSSEGITSKNIYSPPSADNWFGTDDASKDIFSLCMYGTSITMIVGFF